MKLAPQPGPQEAFLASPADVVIYGGAAGGGKTWGLLLEPLRHSQNAGFGAVIFRRESTQITNEGGLWDTALSVYPLLGAEPYKSPKLGFRFPSGARVTFGHLNLENDVLSWQGSQVPLICFDELTHFTRNQFFYMLSRNRSACGVRPYVRCTTNPDADSWVADFISWWIGDDGLPIAERCGLVRYFARVSDALVWGNSAEEVAALAGVEPSECKSLTFISAKLTDNAALMAADPGYMANLKALSRVERERLLGGNWKIRPAAGLYFPRHDATVLDEVPDDVVAWARGWDLAATVVSEATPDPDWTAGVLIGKRRNGRYVVADVARVRRRADEVRELVRRTAGHDGQKTRIAIPQDPGQAGKDQVQNYITHLTGYAVTRRRPSQDKVLRAEPFAAQWQAGKVDVVRGAWNEAFFGEFEAFPDVKHDDQVDGASDAFAVLSSSHVGAVVFSSSDL